MGIACRRLTVSFGLLLLFALAPSVGTAAPPGTPQISVVKVTPWGTEPDVDVHPSNPGTLVFTGRTQAIPEGTGVYPAWTSTNAGQTWSQVMGSGPTNNGDPNIAFDTLGNVYLSVLSPNDNLNLRQGVIVYKSTNAGMTYPSRTWALDSLSSVLFPDGTVRMPCRGASIALYDYAKIATDPAVSSQVYATALCNCLYVGADTTSANAFVRSLDGGATWQQALALPAGSGLINNITVASNGVIYIANAGTTSSCGPGITSGIHLRKSTDHGATFFGPSCLAGEPTATVSYAWTAVHPSDPNQLWIAFNRPANTPGPCLHVYVMRSQDGGGNWTAPVRVDDVLHDDTVDRAKASLSVSSTGRLDIAWFDYRRSNPKTHVRGNQDGDVYYSYSTDGGATWAASLRVTTLTRPTLESAQNDFLTVVSAGDRAYVAYAQDENNDGFFDGFLGTVVFK